MICCLLAGILLQSGIIRAHTRFRPFSFEQKGIRFSIDPRIELYNIMNMLGGITTITPHLSTYKQAIFQHFMPYKEHEGLRFFIRCRMKGWGVDGPTFFMMHLDEKLNLLPGLDESIARKIGGMDTVRQLAKAVRQFSADSHFAAFFNNQVVFYNLILEQTRYAFRHFDERERLERYYGETNAAYHFILNLLEGGGNFGLPVITSKGKELFALISTGRVAGELPVFTPDFITYNLIYHEFGHSFVNALLSADSSTVAKSQHLLEPIRSSMAAQGYDNWLTSGAGTYRAGSNGATGHWEIRRGHRASVFLQSRTGKTLHLRGHAH